MMKLAIGRGVSTLLAVASLSVSMLMAPAAPAFADGAGAGASVPAVAPPPVKGAGGSTQTVEAKISRDEAAAVARKYFAIPADWGEPNISKDQSPTSASWMLNWQSPAKQGPRDTISVQVDGLTGAILSYNRYTEKAPDAAPASPTLTRDEARQAADDWLDKLASDAKGSLRAADDARNAVVYGLGDTYQFVWNRLAQGYPIQGQGVWININANTGELQSYRRWEAPANTQYAVPPTVLTQAQAEAAYRQNLPLTLFYQRYQQPGTNTSTWKLVYQPPQSGYPYLAQDGSFLVNGQPVDLVKVASPIQVPAPEKGYTAPAKPLTEQEALALAQQISGRTDAPTTSYYNEYGDPAQQSHTWSFSWNKQGELADGEYNTDVRIDAEQGVLLSFNNYTKFVMWKEGEQPKVTEEEAQATAISFVQANRPDIAGRLRLVPDLNFNYRLMMAYGKFSSYNFQFNILKNGVLVAGSAIRVEVDARTGAVRSFFADEAMGRPDFPADSSGPAVLPAPDGVIGRDRAIDSWLKNQGLELAWVTLNPPVMKPGVTDSKPPEPKLLWVPGSAMSVASIDGLTGAPLNYEGRDLIELSRRPTDIDGHFAQKEIELLWSRQVFDLTGGKFNPDQPVSAMDLVRWLVLARGMRPFIAYDFKGEFAANAGAAPAAAALASNANAAYFGAALQAGILQPDDFGPSVDPNGPVSRQLFALWAARAMGYGAVVKMPNRIGMDFSDKDAIDAKYANAVGLLNGLGIIKGYPGGAFDPTRTVTRGEAAKVIYSITTEVRR